MILYRICRFICLVVCRLLFNVKVYGKENIPRKGSFILAANHASYLDPVLVGVASSRVLSFMAKEELFRNRLFGGFLRLIGVFPVNRHSLDLGAIKGALRRLGQGRALGLFPQGQRGQEFDLDKSKQGVGFLAARAKVPVVPAFVKGSILAWPKGRKIFRPYPISVYFGKPITYIEGLNREQLTKKVIAGIELTRDTSHLCNLLQLIML